MYYSSPGWFLYLGFVDDSLKFAECLCLSPGLPFSLSLCVSLCRSSYSRVPRASWEIVFSLSFYFAIVPHPSLSLLFDAGWSGDGWEECE